MTDYVRFQETPWLDALVAEHGRFVVIREKGKPLLRQFEDGFWSVIQEDGTETPHDGWMGPERTRDAEYRRGVYLLEVMRQAERTLNHARDELQRERSHFEQTGEPIENVEAKKKNLLALKAAYDEAAAEYDRRVLAPGRAIAEATYRSKVRQEAEVNARQGQMVNQFRDLDEALAQ